jgi:hypothetical protein
LGAPLFAVALADAEEPPELAVEPPEPALVRTAAEVVAAALLPPPLPPPGVA